MAGLDIYTTQQSILTKIGTLPYEVIEGDVGDALTLVQDNGVLETFVIVQFGDMLRASGGSFGGATHDNYYSLVRTLSVASSPGRARKANSVIGQLLLGWEPENGSALVKEWGGGTFTISQENARPLAYSSLSTFRFSTNVVGVGTTVYP